MRTLRQSALAFAVGAWLLASSGGHAMAQQAASPIDDSKLTRLYELFLERGSEDTYLEKRIAEERTLIRSLIDEEIRASLESLGEEKGNLEGTNLTLSLDRQRGVVTSLEERMRERKVDLDLLSEEEKGYYLSPASETGAIEEYRLTHSHGELLAKRAVLEERIAALENVLPQQRDRLSRLKNAQLVVQFGAFISLGVYIGILVMTFLLNTLIQRFIIARIRQRNRRYVASKVATAALYFLALLLILAKLLSDHPKILTSLAIVGAGIAVALQDLVKDVVGWIIILQKRYFSLGDRVSIGGYTGDVIDLSILRTALLEVGMPGGDVLERTGKTLYIPNSLVLSQHVLNYNTTNDFTKAEMIVTITFESDWRKAKKILEQIVKEETEEVTEQARRQYSKRTHLFYFSNEPALSDIFTETASSGIQFTLRFNVPIGLRRDIITRITEKMLERFKKEGIELAYSTVRIIGKG